MTQQLTIQTPQSALSIEQLLGQRDLIQQAMATAMKEGMHFGKIPGCGDKPALFQSGAQLLCHLFRLRPEYSIDQTDLAGNHVRFKITCRLYLMGTDPAMLVSEGVGEGSTMESKHRWRGGSRKCPECGAAAIIKGRKDYGGGWVCFTKKGGCGAKWKEGDGLIEGQSEQKQENENIEDARNTVLKMTKKRAFVDATITATASNDFFTEDLEDIQENIDAVKARREQAEDDIPMNTQPAAKEELPEVTAENWGEVIVHLGLPGGRIHGKKVYELNSALLDWVENKPKGFFADWQANPQYFGPKEKRLKKALEFAIAAKKDKKEVAEINQEPAATKQSFKMLEQLASKQEEITVNKLIIAAVELSIIPPAAAAETLTEEQTQELIGRFSDLVAHIKEEVSK